MVQPAPRMMRAPVKKESVVLRTEGIGVPVYVAARRVEKRQGRKR